MSSFEMAMDHIIAECIEKDRQNVPSYQLSRASTGGIGRLASADWGMVIEGTDYMMQETRIGALSFNAIDFGECVRFPHVMREHLACGDPHEINQCTLLHFCAGLEWVHQKRPKRVPTRTRVDDLAKNMREKEIDAAQKMVEASKGSLYGGRCSECNPRCAYPSS